MPNMVSISRKGEDKNVVVHPNHIDEEICKHLGTEPDPKWYVCGWYDTVGYSMKGSFSEIIEMYKEGDEEESERTKQFRGYTVQILEFLDQNFVLSASYSAF
jgi:hypothetical protein